jgi:hypothetical protein
LPHQAPFSCEYSQLALIPSSKAFKKDWRARQIERTVFKAVMKKRMGTSGMWGWRIGKAWTVVSTSRKLVFPLFAQAFINAKYTSFRQFKVYKTLALMQQSLRWSNVVDVDVTFKATIHFGKTIAESLEPISHFLNGNCTAW